VPFILGRVLAILTKRRLPKQLLHSAQTLELKPKGNFCMRKVILFDFPQNKNKVILKSGRKCWHVTPHNLVEK
jgi:hypothetical protein